MTLKNIIQLPQVYGNVSIDYKKDNIWRNKPVKTCVKKQTNISGRNNKGQLLLFIELVVINVYIVSLILNVVFLI